MERDAHDLPASQAQILLPSQDLVEDMEYFKTLGFRLKNIFPDDEPQVAVMMGHGTEIRLDTRASGPPPTLYLLTDEPQKWGITKSSFEAPNGTKIQVHPKTYEVQIPPTQHKFEVRQLQDREPWVIGRAGMLYRDLVPNRLGGSIMASHIRIPQGGPVPDMVHYHSIGFQLIFCYKGWVKLVYEDQGPPFLLAARDCVTQPPQIRHRVLESSDNLEVVEIGVPAEHMTTIDHDMELPTKDFRPDREFAGQRFCHHQHKDAVWQASRIPGFETRDTGVLAATKGVASVQVLRPKGSPSQAPVCSHDTDILFTFVLQGEMALLADGHETQQLQAGDAYVVPPHMKHQINNFSHDLELMEVSLPGKFTTSVHG